SQQIRISPSDRASSRSLDERPGGRPRSVAFCESTSLAGTRYPRYREVAAGGPRVSNSNEQENATLRAWSESAPYWDKHASVIRAMFEPLSDALIEDADLGPGESALDVAAGTGEPSLRIAEGCGPSTAVICTDPVAGV